MSTTTTVVAPAVTDVAVVPAAAATKKVAKRGFAKFTLAQLKEKAKERGVTGYTHLNKVDLINLIRKSKAVTVTSTRSTARGGSKSILKAKKNSKNTAAGGGAKKNGKRSSSAKAAREVVEKVLKGKKDGTKTYILLDNDGKDTGVEEVNAEGVVTSVKGRHVANNRTPAAAARKFGKIPLESAGYGETNATNVTFRCATRGRTYNHVYTYAVYKTSVQIPAPEYAKFQAGEAVSPVFSFHKNGFINSYKCTKVGVTKPEKKTRTAIKNAIKAVAAGTIAAADAVAPVVAAPAAAVAVAAPKAKGRAKKAAMDTTQ